MKILKHKLSIHPGNSTGPQIQLLVNRTYDPIDLVFKEIITNHYCAEKYGQVMFFFKPFAPDVKQTPMNTFIAFKGKVAITNYWPSRVSLFNCMVDFPSSIQVFVTTDSDNYHYNKNLIPIFVTLDFLKKYKVCDFKEYNLGGEIHFEPITISEEKISFWQFLLRKLGLSIDQH